MKCSKHRWGDEDEHTMRTGNDEIVSRIHIVAYSTLLDAVVSQVPFISPNLRQPLSDGGEVRHGGVCTVEEDSL